MKLLFCVEVGMTCTNGWAEYQPVIGLSRLNDVCYAGQVEENIWIIECICAWWPKGSFSAASHENMQRLSLYLSLVRVRPCGASLLICLLVITLTV